MTLSDFRPLPHPFVLYYAPWKGGSSLSLGSGQPCMAMSRSFPVIGPSLWNRLPPSARASLLSSNFSTFSSLLKTCLFSWSYLNQKRLCLSMAVEACMGAKYLNTIQYNTIQYCCEESFQEFCLLIKSKEDVRNVLLLLARKP